ncbi:serine-rich adhesin for platelets-like [Acropora muricata]|uniref:serine-rich adhesin for platelets-like n=1 Tax=Acropora muricata TaxID=159855 RepID=UPI0034E4D919
MKGPNVPYIAFLSTLHVLAQVTQGSNQIKLSNVQTYSKKQSLENGEPHLLERNLLKQRNRHRKDKSSVHDNVAGSSRSFHDSWNSFQQPIKEPEKNLYNSTPWVRSRSDSFVHVSGGRHNLSDENQKIGKVHRRRLQGSRQEIEFLEDTEESKHDTDEDSIVSENIDAEKNENNDNGNNYVTIIENDDDKADTDVYNTLSSDQAKSEYTNVESSKGENEESDMLAQEVNAVVGELTQSDTNKVSQIVADEKNTQAESDESPKYEPGTSTDDNVIVSIDRGKETGNQSQERSTSVPAEVTLIEDKEEPQTSYNSLHRISNDVWEIIQQGQQNFTDKNAKQQALQWRKNEKYNKEAENTTWQPQVMSQPIHANGPSAANTSAISNLYFGGNVTQTKPGNLLSNTVHSVFFKGDAEEGTPKSSHMIQSVESLRQYGTGNRVKSISDDQHAITKVDSMGGIAEAAFQIDRARDDNRTRLEPLKYGSHTQKGKHDFKNPIYDKLGNRLSMNYKSHDFSERSGDSVVIQTEEINMKAAKENINFTNNDVIMKGLQGNVTSPPRAQYKEKSLLNAKPILPGSFQQNGQPNGIDAFQSERNNSNVNARQQTNFRFSSGWMDESSMNTSLNHEMVSPSQIAIQANGREPSIREPDQFKSASVFGTNRNSTTGPTDLPPQKQLPSWKTYKGDRSLENWSTKYQNLVGNLKELYEKTRGRSSPQNNNENKIIYDVQKMMREVSRFHSLFVGGKSKEQNTRRSESGNVMSSAEKTSNGEDNSDHRSQNHQFKGYNVLTRTYEDVAGDTRSLARSSYPSNISNSKENKENRTSSTEKNNGPSSHEVLMTYFRNESNLREQLQNMSRILSNVLTTNGTAEAKTNDNEGVFSTNNSILNQTRTGHKDVDDSSQNHSISSWSSQMKNGAEEDKEGSLAKYIKEFISLITLNNTMELNRPSGTSVSTPILRTTEFEASKKANVTDMNKNRLIIEATPTSLRYLMKNRSRNSSSTAVKKGATNVTSENDVSNSTAKNNVDDRNKTGNDNNLTSSATLSTQMQRQQTSSFAKSDNHTKEASMSQNINSDLDFLYRHELKSLEISLSQDFMSNWIYYQKSLDQIGITASMLRSGIANLGSPNRLKSIFRKALTGTDIDVLVVGGSISAGGGIEKDRGNVEGVYYRALSDWWNKTVTPITTSQLKINAVAIGGTDSEYFSYCVKNYMRSLPDIVIWELAANDYQRYKGRNFAPAKPLEQLTRIILSLPSHPALIFANFFRGNYYRTTVGQDCPDSEDEGGRTIAEYYKLTALSWRNVICSSLAGEELDLKKLFSSDGYHPSLLGHAQMSTLLISYLKGVLEETVSQQMTLSRNESSQRNELDEPSTTLPKPIFDIPVSPKPYCWTLLTPDYDKKLRNTLPDLEFTEATDFQFANISHWPVRRDRLRCLKAMETGAMLKMTFAVPLRKLSSDENQNSTERELAITTHNSFGGSGAVWVDGERDSAKIIKELDGQRRTQVDVLTQNLAPGGHTMTVWALQPGFCISAVAVL